MDTIDCFCTNTRRAALALTALYDQTLAAHGLKVTQFSLLRAVSRSHPRNLTELAAATGLDRSTIGRNLRLLQREGLVALDAGIDDSRDQIVALTTEGQRRVRAATVGWQRAQRTMQSALGADANRLIAVARRAADTARVMSLQGVSA